MLAHTCTTAIMIGDIDIVKLAYSAYAISVGNFKVHCFALSQEIDESITLESNPFLSCIIPRKSHLSLL